MPSALADGPEKEKQRKEKQKEKQTKGNQAKGIKSRETNQENQGKQIKEGRSTIHFLTGELLSFYPSAKADGN